MHGFWRSMQAFLLIATTLSSVQHPMSPVLPALLPNLPSVRPPDCIEHPSEPGTPLDVPRLQKAPAWQHLVVTALNEACLVRTRS